MTAVARAFPVRVMITDAWDRVPIQASPDTTVAELLPHPFGPSYLDG